MFGSLTAYENVLAAAEIRKGWSRDKTDPKVATEQVLDRVGIRSVANDRVDAMPTGLARLVELGRALAQQPRVLLLDEPASGLDESESDAFADLLLELAGEGMAILMVEHDVPLVMKVCKWIHVLDFGAILAVGTAEDIQQNQLVLDAYLGASMTDAPVEVAPDAPLLELRGVKAAYGRIEVLHGVDLVVPQGSVVALLGPNGGGKTTTLKVISGQMTPTSGCVHVSGRHVNGASPDALARVGVCTIPEGRGVFPNLTVRENLRMVTFAGTATVEEVEEVAYARFPRLGERRSQLAGTMSGGEQQMLALARGLDRRPGAAAARRAVDGPRAAHRGGAVRDRRPGRGRGRVDPRRRAVRPHGAGRGRLRRHHVARPDRERRPAGRPRR